MPHVYLGTSGFSYRDWVGIVYPSDLPARERLAFYGRMFPFLELNATYYRRPEAPAMEHFARRAGVAGLRSVVVKVPGELTHRRPAVESELRDRVTALATGVAPLQDAEILGGLLLQFPYSFHYTRDNRQYLAACLAAMRAALPTVPTFVEFRGADWERGSVSTGLAARGADPVYVDLPGLPGLPSSALETGIGASERVYLRLHGRNAAQWWTGDNTERYDYRYSDAEIETAADRIAGVTTADAVQVLYVAFNNHFRGQAVDNARSLATALAQRGVTVENATERDPGDATYS